jgi:hypothetical protein
VHSRDLLLVFSAALVLQNPKLSFLPGGGGGGVVYSFTVTVFSAVGNDRLKFFTVNNVSLCRYISGL